MEVAPSQMEVVPSKMEVASYKIEVSLFFVDFHDLRTFVAIYILSRFTHFFRNFFLAKIASPHHHTFFACMGMGYFEHRDTLSTISPVVNNM